MKYILLISLLIALPALAGAQTNTAKGEIDVFYKEYFGRMSKRLDTLGVQVTYSKSLSALIEKNGRLCKKYGDGPCGWGSDGNEYLGGAQEYEVGARYESYKYRSSEEQPGYVMVSFNVYPSVVDSDGYYVVEMTYHLIKEGGRWCIDDIIYRKGSSARKSMEAEIASLLESAQ